MLSVAEKLGFMVSRWRPVAVLYILVWFFVIPVILLLLSWAHFAAAAVGGVIILIGVSGGMALLYKRLKRSERDEQRKYSGGEHGDEDGDEVRE